jgi:hypothetical protein
MDCSSIAKSGKATFGLNAFWRGCASRVETGLEVSVVGVINVETGQGYALSAEQTYAELNLAEVSRMDQYLYHLDCVRPDLPPEVKYFAVDGAYAKENFVSGAVGLKLHVISVSCAVMRISSFSTPGFKSDGADHASMRGKLTSAT